jgi:hypothetical protein
VRVEGAEVARRAARAPDDPAAVRGPGEWDCSRANIGMPKQTPLVELRCLQFLVDLDFEVRAQIGRGCIWGTMMFTVTVAGKSSAMNMRFGSAREAVEAYRRVQDEAPGEVTITDNRVHRTIELSELEEQARVEESDAGSP